MADQDPPSPKLDISYILSPNDPDNVPKLVQKISSLGEGLASGKSEERVELLAQARALVLALETPQETMLRQIWANVRPMRTFKPRSSWYLD